MARPWRSFRRLARRSEAPGSPPLSAISRLRHGPLAVPSAPTREVGCRPPDGTWRLDVTSTEQLVRTAGSWGVTPGATTYLLSGMHQMTVEDIDPGRHH